jgi:DNA topoisomerase-1
MKKALVIVESPAKARTISKFLGSGYQVEASIGHIRDLPSSSSEIPPKYKREPWARIGVDVDHDFEPLYIIPEEKKAQVKKLKGLAKEAGELYLATDEDREGEAIAWHLLQVLEPGRNVAVKRMVFHEITKSAIDDALHHPRQIDQQLVDAQEARRILDRLYGYELSPVLWKKVRPKLSAGRVQSVAVRLVVVRERARMRFVTASYWDIDASLQTKTEEKDRVLARLQEVDGKRVAIGKDFDAATGALLDPKTVTLLDEARARHLAEILQDKPFTVTSVTERPFTQRPYPPFITSTLQQESARKLRFPAKRTMRIAQDLYENGFITYMRTDSTNLSQQAITAARNQVAELYGRQFLPEEARVYAKKVKGAQEAHEAIRPAGEVFRTPDQLRGELEEDHFRLYDLIWKRTVASQMKDATGQRTTAQLRAESGGESATFSATGKVISFPGFLRAYVEGTDDPDAELEDQERVLPALKEGQILDAVTLEPKGHETQPPARYTEASLIKELEEKGIGRPSTYASILQTIQDRGYVWKKGTALVPTFTAFAVTNLLEQHFGELVNYDFTAKMEEGLDEIADGEQKAVPWLKHFYFGDPNAKPGDGAPVEAMGLKARIGSGWEGIDPKGVSSVPLGQQDASGRPIFVRVGRFGPYLQAGDSEVRPRVSEEKPPDEITKAWVEEQFARAQLGDAPLGTDPATGKPVYVKNGRFGPYVQLGDMPPVETTPSGKRKKSKGKDENRPKMASLFPGMKPEEVKLEDALRLLSLPRAVGQHSGTGETITAQDGRFGPYLKMGTETRSIDGHEKLFSITLDEAEQVFAQPKQQRGRSQQRLFAELGPHPVSQGVIRVLGGRYGPYVSDGVVNASLRPDQDPATLTREQAIETLNAREAELKDKGFDPRAVKAKRSRRGGSQKAAPKKPAAAEKSVPKRPRKAG